ncbi:MAG TPA: nucleoside 2-deoxyribosyltransferase [Rhodopila sp.]|nr:nucleoside 2-deoxyribosyltransferase [Rhodopila sp.]
MIKVYLAGPDVFLPDPVAWLARKQAICAGLGLTGVSPLDELQQEPASWAALPLWRRLALRNEAHIRGCAAVIANLTPFRGPSADVGTAYEVGFARGLGLPVFGYGTVAAPFLERTVDFLAGQGQQATDGTWWDADGLLVEQFGLSDNLMIEAAIVASGTEMVRQDADRWNDLSVFERCAQQAARVLAGTGVSPA